MSFRGTKLTRNLVRSRFLAAARNDKADGLQRYFLQKCGCGGINRFLGGRQKLGIFFAI